MLNKNTQDGFDNYENADSVYDFDDPHSLGDPYAQAVREDVRVRGWRAEFAVWPERLGV